MTGVLQGCRHKWGTVWIAYHDPDTNEALIERKDRDEWNINRRKYVKQVVTLRQCWKCKKFMFNAPRIRKGSRKPKSIIKVRKAIQQLEPDYYQKTYLIESIQEKTSSDFKTVMAILELYCVIEKDAKEPFISKINPKGGGTIYHVTPPSSQTMSTFIYQGRGSKDWIDGLMVSDH